MNLVKQHAIKILMVSVLGFGLAGCLGSLCNAALGTKKTATAAVNAGTTSAPVNVLVGDTVTTPTDICK